MAKFIVSRPLGLGGPGSGNFGHKGRKGRVGGSSKKGAGTLQPAPRYQVGITSARPGKSDAQVAREMDDFVAAMSATPVTDLSIHLGVGGWDGGSEVTFVTQYTGNGEAKRALAKFAKEHDQDAVLIQQYVKKGTPGAQPQNRVVFNVNVSKESMRDIEDSLVEHDFGGWTWGRYDNKAMLMLTCVPQWGGDAALHRSNFKNLIADLREAQMDFGVVERAVLIEVMGGDDYDRIIG